MKPPVNTKKLRAFLGHIGYYKKIMRNYSNITFHMGELSRENVPFIWTKECIDSFETLKRKLIEAPILRFLNWIKKFHAHINASEIEVGEILTQPRYDQMDHPNSYASRKLNKARKIFYYSKRRPWDDIFITKKIDIIS